MLLGLGLYTQVSMTCALSPSSRPLALLRRGWGGAEVSRGRQPDHPARDANCHGASQKQPLSRCALLRTFSVNLLQALYDHLMDFLADRGVDNTFADELIELSTALEHQEYITFLEDLKSFVKCQ